jgi:hypothetical protein
MVLVVLVAGTLSVHSLPEIHQCPAGTLSLTMVLMVLATTTVAGRVADKILTVLPLAVLALTPSAGVVAMMAAATLPAPITAAARVHLLCFIGLPSPGRPIPAEYSREAIH